MAPLRLLIRRSIARPSYKTTHKARAGEIPLTTTRAWPGEHSIFHSQHSKNDEESGEFGEEGWASKVDTVTSKAGESESKSNTQPYASQFRSVVVNSASADPRASGISEEVPCNQIKVSKDLMWSEETKKERNTYWWAWYVITITICNASAQNHVRPSTTLGIVHATWCESLGIPLGACMHQVVIPFDTRSKKKHRLSFPIANSTHPSPLICYRYPSNHWSIQSSKWTPKKNPTTMPPQSPNSLRQMRPKSTERSTNPSKSFSGNIATYPRRKLWNMSLSWYVSMIAVKEHFRANHMRYRGFTRRWTLGAPVANYLAHSATVLSPSSRESTPTTEGVRERWHRRKHPQRILPLTGLLAIQALISPPSLQLRLHWPTTLPQPLPPHPPSVPTNSPPPHQHPQHHPFRPRLLFRARPAPARPRRRGLEPPLRHRCRPQVPRSRLRSLPRPQHPG